MNKGFYRIRLLIAAFVGLLALVAVVGFYPIKIMNIQLTALIQKTITDFSIPLLLILLGIFVLTLFFGRFYCSLICPFGILQEFFAFLSKKKKPFEKSLVFKYFILALTFGCLIGGSSFLIKYIDPYTLFGSVVSISTLGIVATIVVLAIVFYKNRLFCTNICPVGALLGLISKFSINKIYIDKDKCVNCSLCSKNCPSGCIDHKEPLVNNETCVKCLKCLSICKKGAIKFGKKEIVPKFNLKRRELILATAALVLFSGAIKTGVELSKSIAKKVKNVILPPGAKNANNMANKCLNCNLCVNNCPNSILTKADSTFQSVHIDYSKGKKHCEYDCNECSEVCPAGAIKTIDLKEKQNLRIAMAMIEPDKCTKCGICFYNCPKEAIIKAESRYFINGTKCIGCGLCKAKCQSGAIEIYPINEQTII